MSFQGKLSYERFVVQTINSWTQICDRVMREPTAVQMHEARERLTFVRGIVASWPAHAIELRHQHSLLVLIDDTILWIVALACGDDGESAARDMIEAMMAAHVEVQRLARARLGGHA